MNILNTLLTYLLETLRRLVTYEVNALLTLLTYLFDKFEIQAIYSRPFHTIARVIGRVTSFAPNVIYPLFRVWWTFIHDRWFNFYLSSQPWQKCIGFLLLQKRFKNRNLIQYFQFFQLFTLQNIVDIEVSKSKSMKTPSVKYQN